MGYTIQIKEKSGKPYLVNAIPLGSINIINPTFPSEARLDITFNYDDAIKKAIGFSLKELDGKCVEDSIKTLRNAIRKLKDDYNSDYWMQTEGNVKLALQGLVALASQCPDGIWEVLM